MRSGYKDPEFKDIGIKGEAQVRVTTSDGKSWELKEGDSLFFRGVKVGQDVKVENIGTGVAKDAEFLLFDLRPDEQ